MQTLLLAAVVLLGLQLFMFKPPQDPRSPQDFLAALNKEVKELQDEAAKRSVSTGQIIREWEKAGRTLQIRAQVPSLTWQDSEKVLRFQNQFLLDQTATQYLGFHLQKIQAAQEAGSLKKEEAENAKMVARVLTANASFKAGTQRNDFYRLNAAYMTLQTQSIQHAGKPEWEKMSLEIPSSAGVPAETTTPKAMFDRIVTDLSARSKKDLVWGVVPGYALIDTLVKLTGSVPAFSYAFAALLLAIVVRAVVYPLTQRQLMWSRQMAQLKPLIEELKEKYGKGGIELNQKMMELYKEYGINPTAGCLPVMLQMPLFLMVYQCMVHYRFEFQKGTFLWVNPSTAESASGWIGPNLGQMDYILITIYGISMVVSTLLAPVTDPANQKQQRIMGISIALLFSVMMFFYPLPSAFVLYWIFTNVLASAQSLRAYRMPLPPLQKVNAPGGAVFPTNGSLTGKNGNTGTPVRHKPKPKPKKK